MNNDQDNQSRAIRRHVGIILHFHRLILVIADSTDVSFFFGLRYASLIMHEIDKDG